MCQTLSIWDNHLAVFVCLGICFGICPEICLAEKKIKRGGSNENFRRPWNLMHSLPCRTPRRFSIHEIFFGPLGHHLSCVKWVGRSLSALTTHESSWIAMVMGLQCCVWSGLEMDMWQPFFQECYNSCFKPTQPEKALYTKLQQFPSQWRGASCPTRRFVSCGDWPVTLRHQTA